MHHWLIRPKVEGSRNHRWHWEEHLTPRLIRQLTVDQKAVLMLGEVFDIDPVRMPKLLLLYYSTTTVVNVIYDQHSIDRTLSE